MRHPQQHLRAAALAAALFALAAAAPAQTARPEEQSANRSITVEEAIRMALTNDVDILISQQNPVVDQFSLNALYSAYDPVFGWSASHNFNSSPGGVDPTTDIPYPPNNTTTEDYQLSLNGSLPTGLTYAFNGPLYRQEIDGFLPNPIFYSEAGVTLSQPLLRNFWIDNTRWQIAASRRTLRIDQLGLRLQIMTVINNVKAAYYNLVYARENVQVEGAAVQLAQELANENKQKVKLGALAPLDEAQAESQAASAQSDLLTAELALASQENTLKSLIALNMAPWERMTPVPSEPLIAVPEDPSLVECWRTALDNRPDLLQARESMEKQRIAVKYSFNQLFPELDVTGSYGQNATTAGFSENLETLRQGTYPFYSYGVTLSVPLGNVGPRNQYRSSRATLKQLLYQLKKVENTIIVAIDNDVKTVRSDWLKIDSTRQARQYAEQALAAEQTKLEHGMSTSFVVLQLQNSLTTARSAELRALADYNIAVEQLDFDEGVTLERNHIFMAKP